MNEWSGYVCSVCVCVHVHKVKQQTNQSARDSEGEIIHNVICIYFCCPPFFIFNRVSSFSSSLYSYMFYVPLILEYNWIAFAYIIISGEHGIAFNAIPLKYIISKYLFADVCCYSLSLNVLFHTHTYSLLWFTFEGDASRFANTRLKSWSDEKEYAYNANSFIHSLDIWPTD